MKEKRRYLGKWELGCMVFHACLYKMFTAYPAQFFRISGSAAALTALYSGVVFLIVLFLILMLLRKFGVLSRLFAHGSTAHGAVRCLLAIYWLFGLVYALQSFLYVLHHISYMRSPDWFLILFFLIGAGVTALCGAKAVYRMHSLMVPLIGTAAIVIAILGLKYAEPLYLTPILGSGAAAVFGTGLSTLFLYSDSVLILQLIPRCRKEVKPVRTVMIGASLAVLCNVVLMLLSAMSYPAAMEPYVSVLLYPLTKAAYFGKFWSRLDALYLLAFLVSAFLYGSMALHLFLLAVGERKGSFFGKRLAAGVLCLAVCMQLTGCYDGREVEESAYVIALGVDLDSDANRRYTFQLSNPLELGGSRDLESENRGEENTSGKNHTVSNITIAAEDFYMAQGKLKSYLSKMPELSHLKVIAFSKQAARAGILDQATLFYQNAQVRPSVNVCLVDSAQEFLNQVNPSLEESTARYYELLFQNRNTPYAPVTELREFVARAAEDGWDPVLPIANNEKLEGMGVFQDGVLVLEMDAESAMLYKLLSGEAREVTVHAGDTTYFMTGKHRMQIRTDPGGTPPKIAVKSRIRAYPADGGGQNDAAQLSAQLEEKMTEFLKDTLRSGADVLGIGAQLRTAFRTQAQWEAFSWREKQTEFDIFSQTTIQYEKME